MKLAGQDLDFSASGMSADPLLAMSNSHQARGLSLS